MRVSGCVKKMGINKAFKVIIFNTINPNVKLNSKLGTFFFNWDSLHARLSSHYEARSYKKKKYKKVKACRKSV